MVVWVPLVSWRRAPCGQRLYSTSVIETRGRAVSRNITMAPAPIASRRPIRIVVGFLIAWGQRGESTASVSGTKRRTLELLCSLEHGSKLRCVRQGISFGVFELARQDTNFTDWPSPLAPLPRRAGEGNGIFGWHFPGRRSPNRSALGYYHAAPSGLRAGAGNGSDGKHGNYGKLQMADGKSSRRQTRGRGRERFLMDLTKCETKCETKWLWDFRAQGSVVRHLDAVTRAVRGFQDDAFGGVDDFDVAGGTQGRGAEVAGGVGGETTAGR